MSMKLTIGPDGKVEKIEILSGVADGVIEAQDARLIAAAKTAAMQWE